MRDYIPAALMAVFGIGAVGIAQFLPPSSGAVIAVFPKETGMDTVWQAVDDTDAYLVRATSVPGTFVLYSDEDAFPRRLRQHGAVLVLDYLGAEWCGSRVTNPAFSAQTT